jgi:hypothetical protein
MWEQARRSTALARDRWAQLCEARKVLIDSLSRAGFPVSEATQELEKLMEEQARHYERALWNMENLCRACDELRAQLEKMHFGPSVN